MRLKRMSKEPISLERVEPYLAASARPLDLASFQYHFRGGSSEAVMQELASFQNEDGGFGSAVEPDLRLPSSTALATWMAFQTVKELDDVDGSHPVVRKAIAYLLETYQEEKVGWPIVVPEVDEHPHPPWWTYASAMEHFSWANPAAELLGILMTYGEGEGTSVIEALKKKALEQVFLVDPSDFHDVFNYKGLYELADADLQSQLREPVEKLILAAVSTNPEDWGGYVATPLKFISGPEDLFAGLFDENVIQQNLTFLQSRMVDGSHWEPNWNWGELYPDVWETAKQEWSGHLTVKHLVQLKAFGIQ